MFFNLLIKTCLFLTGKRAGPHREKTPRAFLGVSVAFSEKGGSLPVQVFFNLGGGDLRGAGQVDHLALVL